MAKKKRDAVRPEDAGCTDLAVPEPHEISHGALTEEQALAVGQLPGHGKRRSLSAPGQVVLGENYSQAQKTMALPVPWQPSSDVRYNTAATEAQDRAERTERIIARGEALVRQMSKSIAGLACDGEDVESRRASVIAALAALMETPDLPHAMACFSASALANAAGDEFGDQVRALFTAPGEGLAATLDAMAAPRITRMILLTRLELMQELALTQASEIAILDQAMMALAQSRVQDIRANAVYRQMGNSPAGVKAYTGLAEASRVSGQTSAALIEKLRMRHHPTSTAAVSVYAASGAAVMVASSAPDGPKAAKPVATRKRRILSPATRSSQ